MSSIDIKIPDHAAFVLRRLEENGYEAWCVGGCVRDAVCKQLGISSALPHDWDICTSAMPDEMLKVFEDMHVIPTGIKHGTITVFSGGRQVEVTTYRTDGDYVEHRFPESVKFVRDIKSDLERRDFTMNAICCDIRGNIYDPFGGQQDIKQRIIRCVGEPRKRFDEDALRILRLVRFSAKTGFDTESETEYAALQMCGLLDSISAERILSELKGLLIQRNVMQALDRYREIIAQIIPEIRPCFGFEQRNPHHCYDVYEHIIHAVENCRPDPLLRMVMLLHDIAKPEMFTVDQNGIGHFKGHPQKSAEYAYKILLRLKSDNDSRHRICALIKEHDNRIPADKRSVRRFISKYDADFFMDHLEVRRADTLAQSGYRLKEKLSELDELAKTAIELTENNECMKLSQLEVNGKDMMQIGLSGRDIGETLKYLLREVIEERVSNNKNELTELAEKYAAQGCGKDSPNEEG